MRDPTVKTLQERLEYLNLDQCKILRKLMKNETNPKEFKSVIEWVAQCYNEPSNSEMIMCAINEVMEGYGIEPLNDTCGECYSDIAEYINVGDPYINTIIRETNGNFVCASWGDYIEN